jgi:hypothetical protein
MTSDLALLSFIVGSVSVLTCWFEVYDKRKLQWCATAIHARAGRGGRMKDLPGHRVLLLQRANVIAPGPTKTVHFLAARVVDPVKMDESQPSLDCYANPAEIADATLFLASNLARFVTGPQTTP